jgi:hypothetical protein
MTAIPDLLERIRETEKNKLSAFTLFFGYVTIAPTDHYARPALVKEDTNEIRFHAKVFILYVLALFTTFVLAVTAVDIIGHFRLSTVPFLFFLVVINLLIWSAIHSSRRRYTININREELSACGKVFKWSEIKATAILNLPKGKQGTDYLVVVLQDETYYKCNLGYFISYFGFADKLSSYIEHLRPVS